MPVTASNGIEIGRRALQAQQASLQVTSHNIFALVAAPLTLGEPQRDPVVPRPRLEPRLKITNLVPAKYCCTYFDLTLTPSNYLDLSRSRQSTPSRYRG